MPRGHFRHAFLGWLWVLGVALALAALPSLVHADVSFDFDADSGGFTPSDLGGNPVNQWTYGPAAGVGGNGAWFINTSSIVSGKALTSPTLTVAGAGNVTLTFNHRFNFETQWDGGNLYKSINAGTFVLVPDADFIVSPYTHTLNVSGNPIGGQRAWSNISAGYATPAYITSSATLGTLNGGDTVAFRFVGGWDGSIDRPSPNWVIDDVAVTNVVPEPSTMALLFSAGVAGLAWRRRKRAATVS